MSKAEHLDEGAFDMADCLQRVRQHDEAAARLLMERLYPLVLKIVRAHLPRRASEEDLVQTVFMKVFANLGSYSHQVPVEHWVSRIAVNHCLNEIKAEKIRPEYRWSDLSEDEQRVLEGLASDQSGSARADAFAARDLLDKLMEELNPQDRMLVRIFYLEDKSAAEVRELTGWSLASIKVRAFRARRKMQKTLNQLLEDEAI
jgi:RNA polymerase sigma-70 factor, ECF subfamily